MSSPPKSRKRIGVVAPASRLTPEVAAQVTALAASRYPDGPPDIVFHPQCFLSDGHFAGDDAARAAAFLEVANDETFDALWFARGGYGSCRLAETIVPNLTDAARRKAYLGYSDAGSLLGALYGQGFAAIAHGPMAQDIARSGGEDAVARALGWLTAGEPSALEPSVDGRTPTAAFNIAVLSALVGTPFQPDLAGHVLMLEEVSEHLYALDRFFFHLTSNPGLRRVAGIRLGRCSDIPPNDPPFGADEAAIAQDWCARSGIAYLGRADIGHDADNKVVPFGLWRPA